MCLESFELYYFLYFLYKILFYPASEVKRQCFCLDILEIFDTAGTALPGKGLSRREGRCFGRGADDEIAAGGKIDELAADDPAGVGKGLCGDSLNKIAFDEAAVVNVAGNNARVFAAGETGAGRFDGACPASSIDDGHQYVLAINHARFHPDDVLGELGNLFGRQGNARGEVETLRCIQALWLSILLPLHILDVIPDG